MLGRRHEGEKRRGRDAAKGTRGEGDAERGRLGAGTLVKARWVSDGTMRDVGNSTGIPPGVRRLTRTRTRRLPAPVVVGAGKRAGKPQGTRTDTRGGIPAGIEVR